MMGRWIKGSGWYPNFRQPQLFRKGAMRYQPDPVHEGYELLTGKPLGRLRNAIQQFPFRNLDEVIRKMNRYSSLGAREARRASASRCGARSATARGRSSSTTSLKRGFKDGWAGFVIALRKFRGHVLSLRQALRAGAGLEAAAERAAEPTEQ